MLRDNRHWWLICIQIPASFYKPGYDVRPVSLMRINLSQVPGGRVTEFDSMGLINKLKHSLHSSLGLLRVSIW